MARLATGCSQIDDLLGGGIEPGIVTLLYGESGAGKTNICLQSARNAVREGRGKVAFLDTEGVSIERLHQICGADAEAVMRSILFYRPVDLPEQEQMVAALAKLQSPALLVVDSVNHHYRMALGGDGASAGRSMAGQLGALLAMARTLEIPVLVTAQVYRDAEAMQPFGGRTLDHLAKTALRLERVGIGTRRAVLTKHRSRVEGAAASFQITQEGLD